MESVGRKLQQKREKQAVSLGDLAKDTRIGRDYLEALERDEFEGLPGRAFGKLYIRAYAERLGFDPEPLIGEYDRALREREPAEAAPGSGEPEPRRRVGEAIARWREARIAEFEQGVPESVAPEEEAAEDAEVSAVEAPEIVAEPEKVPETEELTGESNTLGDTLVSRRAVFLAVAALVAVAILAVLLARAGREEAPGRPEPVPPPATEISAPTDVPMALDREPLPQVAETSGLRVSEFAVGRVLRGQRLLERGDRFEEGEVVWFQTRVLGGSAGDVVRHVWLLDGYAMQTIELELGGPHWRTHSKKTLHGVGRWRVEARDAAGRVLAASTFDVR